jgi:hypothetical protein
LREPVSKITVGVSQVIEHLLCKLETLSLNPNPTKKKKKKEKGNNFNFYLFIWKNTLTLKMCNRKWEISESSCLYIFCQAKFLEVREHDIFIFVLIAKPSSWRRGVFFEFMNEKNRGNGTY